jgi:Holliday junction resolvasome RuvABC DNA-binding subunit
MNAELILYALIALAIIGNALSVLSKKYPNFKLLKVASGIITSLGAADMAKFAAVATSNEMKTLLFVKAVISKSAEEFVSDEKNTVQKSDTVDVQEPKPSIDPVTTPDVVKVVNDVEHTVEKSV